MKSEKNRKLSAKEQRRLNVFEDTCERLSEEGYNVMILSAGGDIMIVRKVMKFKKQDESKEILIYDHPTQAGSVIFEK